MPLYSAFSRYGMLRYSSRDPESQRIYLAMRRALGSDFNQSFDGSRVQARLYAQAMGLACALLTLERARNQLSPLKAYEMIPALEREFKIVPSPSATVAERRAELAVRMLVSRGARFEAVETILRDILGDDFIEYRTTEAAGLVTSPSNPETVGNWVKPGTRCVLLRAVDSIMPGTRNVQTTLLAGDLATVGQTAIVDAHDPDVRERVTFTVVSGNQITAVFAKAHGVGALITTQYFPIGTSNARDNLVLAETSAATDAETRRRVHAALGRVLRGVSRWAVADESGPFTVGGGLLGVTTIGAT